MKRGVYFAIGIWVEVLIFLFKSSREGSERPSFPPQMATPVPAPQIYEYVLRRTFWSPMIKIIAWHVFLFFMKMLIIFVAGALGAQLLEGRLHVLFHALLLIGTVWILLYWNAVRYTITNDKIIIEKGILTIDRNTFLFRNIESVKLHKTVFGRLCWFGTIEMYAPTLQEMVRLSCIAEARKYFKLIQKNITEHRRTRLVYPSDRVIHGLEKQKRDMKVTA